MVGQDGDAHGFVPCLHLVVDRGHDAAVEILDGADLQVEVAIMTGFVAGFHMQKHEVVVPQSLDGGSCLALVVGVIESGGTFHLNNLQPCIVTNALDEVDGRNDAARFYLGVNLTDSRHRRTVARTPRPDGIGLVVPLGASFLVEGMLRQQFLGVEDKLVDELGGSSSSHPAFFRRVGIAFFGFHE